MLRARRPEALFVDLDGTLADSHGALRACFEGFLAKRGIVAKAADFDALDGVRLGEIPARLQERFALDEPVDELRGEYEASVASAYAQVAPAEGSHELVRAASAAGVRLVLVTSAPRPIADSFLRASGLAEGFEAVVSGEDGPGKPDPALFLRALALTRVGHEQAVAVEDAPSGVRAARAAGLQVLGVTADESRAVSLRVAGATDVAPDLRAVARSLAGLERAS